MIRLMTHNVWNRDTNDPRWEAMGETCAASARIGGLLRVYRETLPDVIGGQEVSALMADLLKEGLTKEHLPYTLIWGRFTPILFRSDKLELIDSAFGTYPEHVPGLGGSFNDVKSKAWNLGVFRIKETGNVFIFITTHLWWKLEPTDDSQIGQRGYQAGSDKAREHQITTLLEIIAHYRSIYGCPTVLVGDMNTTYDSAAMQLVRDNGFRHAHDIATDYAEEAVGYHYCFSDGFKTVYDERPFKTAIDQIYVIGERDGSVKRFERYSPDYYFKISDHSPAYIDVAW